MTAPTDRLVIEAELRGDMGDQVDAVRHSLHELGDEMAVAYRQARKAEEGVDRVRGSVNKLDGSTVASSRSLNRWERAAERAGDRVGTAIGKGVTSSVRHLGRLSGGLMGAVKGLAKYGAAGVAVAGAGGALLGKSLLDTAARMEGLANKAKTVFGKELPGMSKWAEDNATKMGLTRSAAVGLAAGFQDLLVPMGFTRGEGAKMSREVIGLSGALSQWSGGTKSASEVADTLSKAMLGERDELKGLGISISEADVAAELHRKHQDKLTGVAKQQAEAIATQTLIFGKSTDAQAAYAKGGLKVAGSVARVKAGFSELKERTATALAPTMVKGLEWLLAKMPGLGRGLHYVGVEVRKSFGSFRESIGDALGAWTGPGSLLDDNDKPKTWGTRIGKVIGGVVRGLGNLIEGVSKADSKLTDFFAQAAEAGAGMLRTLADVMDAIARLPGPWGDSFRESSQSVRDAATKLDDLAVKADRLNGKRVVFSVTMTSSESVGALLGTGNLGIGPALPSSQTRQPGSTGDFLSSFTGVKPKGQRAAGGRVGPGSWLVGEHGPEILEIGAPGFVLPNEALDRIASGAVRGAAAGRYASTNADGTGPLPDVTVNFWGDVTSDVDVEGAVERGIAKAERKRRERTPRAGGRT